MTMNGNVRAGDIFVWACDTDILDRIIFVIVHIVGTRVWYMCMNGSVYSNAVNYHQRFQWENYGYKLL